jgi:hypothetical protein
LQWWHNNSSALRSNVDIQFTNRQNVDKITENVDFIWPRLTPPHSKGLGGIRLGWGN